MFTACRGLTLIIPIEKEPISLSFSLTFLTDNATVRLSVVYDVMDDVRDVRNVRDGGEDRGASLSATSRIPVLRFLVLHAGIFPSSQVTLATSQVTRVND